MNKPLSSDKILLWRAQNMHRYSWATLHHVLRQTMASGQFAYGGGIPTAHIKTLERQTSKGYAKQIRGCNSKEKL